MPIIAASSSIRPSILLLAAGLFLVTCHKQPGDACQGASITVQDPYWDWCCALYLCTGMCKPPLSWPLATCTLHFALAHQDRETPTSPMPCGTFHRQHVAERPATNLGQANGYNFMPAQTRSVVPSQHESTRTQQTDSQTD
ncbi:hypothetical protein F4859DRAFT_509968 [Xylaria cf. heliscus]|nr:hypothetical protein F4859DRAFT_509968 [Xylaria cf. heliscus]